MLVVDDDPQVREALRTALTRLGYRVAVAGDGREGLQQAIALKPHLIVLDLLMPGLDGHAVLRHLKERGVDAPVIVVSAHGGMEDVIQVLRAGAVDFMRKPWTCTELASVVARALAAPTPRGSGVAGPRSSGSSPQSSAMPAPSSLRLSSRHPASARLLTQLGCDSIAIPSVPSVIAELRALVLNAEAPIEKVASLVERDQGLLSRVLRLGRSAQYSGIGKTADVRLIISRVGFRQIHGLVEAVWMNSCFQIRDPRYLPYAARIARFALARAVAMRALAGFGRVDGCLAYLGGLFADVGALFLLAALAGKAAETPEPEVALELAQEQHASAGARLLTHWGHDPSVVRFAQSHHGSPSASSPDASASMAVLASVMAADLSGDRDLTAKESEQEAALVERCAASLGVAQDARRSLVERLRAEYANALEVLG